MALQMLKFMQNDIVLFAAAETTATTEATAVAATAAALRAANTALELNERERQGLLSQQQV